MPVKTGAALGQQQERGQEEGGGDAAPSVGAGQGRPQRDVMDDLVESLAALEDSH